MKTRELTKHGLRHVISCSKTTGHKKTFFGSLQESIQSTERIENILIFSKPGTVNFKTYIIPLIRIVFEMIGQFYLVIRVFNLVYVTIFLGESQNPILA